MRSAIWWRMLTLLVSRGGRHTWLVLSLTTIHGGQQPPKDGRPGLQNQGCSTTTGLCGRLV